MCCGLFTTGRWFVTTVFVEHDTKPNWVGFTDQPEDDLVNLVMAHATS